MRVLCVGGIADGEQRDVPYELKHGIMFRAIESLKPLLEAGPCAASPSTINVEWYKVHEFRTGGSEASRWVAAPSSWNTQRLLDRLIAAYARRRF